MTELPQEPIVPGDSPIVEPAEPVVTPPAAEPTEEEQKIEASVDKLFEDKKFVDTFFSRVGDGVSKIVDKRVSDAMSQLEPQQPAPSHVTPGNPVEPVAPEPAKVPTQTVVENPKEEQDDELATLKAKVSELEGTSLSESVRNLDVIQQLSQLNAEDATRFAQRITNTAQANNISPTDVGTLVAEGTGISRDIQNQLTVLKSATQHVPNIPNKAPLVPAAAPPESDKWAKINAAFLKK